MHTIRLHACTLLVDTPQTHTRTCMYIDEQLCVDVHVYKHTYVCTLLYFKRIVYMGLSINAGAPPKWLFKRETTSYWGTPFWGNPIYIAGIELSLDSWMVGLEVQALVCRGATHHRVFRWRPGVHGGLILVTTTMWPTRNDMIDMGRCGTVWQGSLGMITSLMIMIMRMRKTLWMSLLLMRKVEMST